MKVKKLICIILALCLLCGCGAAAAPSASAPEPESAEAPAEATAEAPAEEPEQTEPEGLQFRDLDAEGFDLPRATARTSAAETIDLPEADFVALCETEVLPLLSDHSYVTLDFGDGTGLVFLGDLAVIYYGAIDKAGTITTAFRYYAIQDGVLSCQDTDVSPEDKLVWISASGSKYHKDPDCSGMQDPTQVKEEDAIAQGYEACGRCKP